MIGTAGYYSAYVYVIWRTVTGSLRIGTLTFLTGAIVQASGNIQQIFSPLSSIADQALFLTDLLAFFEMQPTIRSKPNALPAPRPICADSNFAMFLSAIPEVPGWCSTVWTSSPRRRTRRTDRRKRRRQDHPGEADDATLRSG